MLLEDDTFILELYSHIYVWQGKKASANEKHMSFLIANKYKKEWNKPKGTQITRIPQGIEDTLFVSFFEGFYQGEEVDMGLFTNNVVGAKETKKNQDISIVANQHLEASKLMMEQLGKDYTVTVYQLIDDCKNVVKVENPKEYGLFFADEVYCVDV